MRQSPSSRGWAASYSLSVIVETTLVACLLCGSAVARAQGAPTASDLEGRLAAQEARLRQQEARLRQQQAELRQQEARLRQQEARTKEPAGGAPQSLGAAQPQSNSAAHPQSISAAPPQSISAAPPQSNTSTHPQSISAAPPQSNTSAHPQSNGAAPPQSNSAAHPQSISAAPPQSISAAPPQSNTSAHPQSISAAPPQSNTSAHPQSNGAAPPQSNTSAHPQSISAAPPQSNTSAHPQSISAAPPQSISAVHPQSNSAVRPQSNSAVRPQSNGAVRPQSNGAVRPQSNGASPPQPNSAAHPQSISAAPPQSNSAVRPQSNGAAHPQSISAAEPQSNGAVQPQPNGAALPQSNGAALPQSNGAALPQSNSASLPQSNGAAQPQSNSASLPQSNGAALPQSNGAAQPQSNSAVRPQSNSAVRPQSNGALQPQSNSALQPQSNSADALRREPIFGYGSDGFVLGGKDFFQVRLRALVQTDARAYFDTAATPLPDQFLIRRARPIIEGTVADVVDFKLMPDFGQGTVVLFDAYIDLRPWRFLALRVGKFKTPFGLERLQNDANMAFLERGLPSNLVPDRDIGASLHGDLGGASLLYEVGVFDGTLDNGSIDADTNDGKDVVARFFSHPLRRLHREIVNDLGIGFAVTYGKEHGTAAMPGLPTYKTTGQNIFFSYLFDPTLTKPTVIAIGDRYRLTPQLYWYAGPVGLLAEYVYNATTVTNDLSGLQPRKTLAHQSWQVELQLVLTGEHATYNGVKPRRPFSLRGRGVGAFEIAGRCGQLLVDPATFPTYADPTKSARSALEWGVGLNWYLLDSVKLAADFERTTFTGGAGMGDRRPENALLARVQLWF